MAQASTAHWLTLRGNTSLYADSECSLSEIDPQEDYEESKCLFCSQVFSLPQDTFGHCKTEHGFDFLAIKQSLHLDFYKCIRMLNYIRSQVNENPALSATKDYAFTGKEAFWEDDHFLQPVLEEDALLHAFEELELDDKEAPQSLDVESKSHRPHGEERPRLMHGLAFVL
ncbi:hypothetical protein BDF14DRAFT_224436 [Spinellus fusiger]|nr:hypothetical protein BDF14DRAFT_224436 [Spinellus fusiger]